MSDLYSLTKIIHISTVTFTGLYFILRGLAQFRHHYWFKKRWARKISQFNDTVLLLSGFTMALMLGQYSFVNNWLPIKLLLVLAYIILGMLAFYWLHRQQQKILVWSGAVMLYAYIIGVAINKNPSWLVAIL